MKFILTTIVLSLSTASCTLPFYRTNVCNTYNEIKIDKTPLDSAIKLIGQFDDLIGIRACGFNSGHNSDWYIYKKFEFAIFVVNYIPEKQNGYKNNIIRDIGIFDTTKLLKRGSKQRYIYNEQDFYSITKANLALIMGKPNKIKNVDTLQYHYYPNKNMVFTFNKTHENFVSLYFLSKK